MTNKVCTYITNSLKFKPTFMSLSKKCLTTNGASGQSEAISDVIISTSFLNCLSCWLVAFSMRFLNNFCNILYVCVSVKQIYVGYHALTT